MTGLYTDLGLIYTELESFQLAIEYLGKLSLFRRMRILLPPLLGSNAQLDYKEFLINKKLSITRYQSPQFGDWNHIVLLNYLLSRSSPNSLENEADEKFKHLAAASPNSAPSASKVFMQSSKSLLTS